MGSEDTGGILYCFDKYGNAEPICLTNIVNVEIDTNDQNNDYLDEPFINLKSVTDTLSFTIEAMNTHFLRRWFRSCRRFSRKKAQQNKRRIAKEKKHGLLHTET